MSNSNEGGAQEPGVVGPGSPAGLICDHAWGIGETVERADGRVDLTMVCKLCGQANEFKGCMPIGLRSGPR